MTDEILKAIQNSLPAMQVDVLKAELKKAEQLPMKDQEIARLNGELDRIKKQLSEQQIKRYDADSRAKKTEELAEQERNIKVKMLELELKIEKDASARVEKLAMAAFCNPMIHKTYSTPLAVPGTKDYSGTVQTATGSETTTVD